MHDVFEEHRAAEVARAEYDVINDVLHDNAYDLRRTIWKITVLIETDDHAFLDATLDAIKEALCGPEDTLGPEHLCDPPWYMITTSMPKKKAKYRRDLPNR